ncbi:alpha beta hydrolase [Cyclospora cayetanensis]|uniref:Alpha beta hydrolase n=1 Tax=Cyclospora cayetanensis TaxID=88456 RepID=A0A1D3D009_9EIME|nr:alpha beta hydrolase [Cyclospora cayetanensis]
MGSLLDRLVFMPPPKTDISLYPVEYLRTAKGSIIPFVFIRGSSPLTLLYSHGNAEDLGGALRYVRGFMAALGVSICCYEYSGYGHSRGQGPSETHVYADIEAAFNQLIHRHHVPQEQIVVVGRSLGTGPSTFLAAKYPGIKALVLISALASVYRVSIPVQIQSLPGDRFCSIDRMLKVKAPLLLLHGTNDKLTSPEHARALAEKAGAEYSVCCFLSGATHRTILSSDWRPIINDEIKQFLINTHPPRSSSTNPKEDSRRPRTTYMRFKEKPTFSRASIE